MAQSKGKRGRCSQCRFWERIDAGSLTDYELGSSYVSDTLPEGHSDFVGVGHCLRFPPVLLNAAVLETIAMVLENHRVRLGTTHVAPLADGSQWPVTWEFDWCGEFQP